MPIENKTLAEREREWKIEREVYKKQISELQKQNAKLQDALDESGQNVLVGIKRIAEFIGISSNNLREIMAKHSAGCPIKQISDKGKGSYFTTRAAVSAWITEIVSPSKGKTVLEVINSMANHSPAHDQLYPQKNARLLVVHNWQEEKTLHLNSVSFHGGKSIPKRQ